jgi:2-methylcitrate dehydratase
VAQTANALAIAGTAYNALRVTRTGELSNWKGLAFPDAGRNALHAVLLARQGITGPLAVFEGNKGWRETISGPWELDWSKENLERVTMTDLKRFNAEIHSQSAIEGMLELGQENQLSPADIESIRIDIFDVAYNIIGGGEEGDKTVVRTKEQADHSLQYMVAVAALDGQVLPEQYQPERILRPDVQSLLRRVIVTPNEEYSRLFPAEHACKLTVTLKDGQRLVKEKTAYTGFHTRPMPWQMVETKFRRLTAPYADGALQQELIDAVRSLDSLLASDLIRLLASVRQP